MVNGEQGSVYSKLAYALAGQDKPTNAQVILALAKARDIDALSVYLKRLAREDG